MAGTSKGWGLTSVMCPGSGSCLFTKLVETQPGNTILGTITQLSGNVLNGVYIVYILTYIMTIFAR